MLCCRTKLSDRRARPISSFRFGRRENVQHVHAYSLSPWHSAIVMGTIVKNTFPTTGGIAAEVTMIACCSRADQDDHRPSRVRDPGRRPSPTWDTGGELGRTLAKPMGWFVSASLFLAAARHVIGQPARRVRISGTLPDRASHTGCGSAFSIEKSPHLIRTSIANRHVENAISRS